MAQNKTSWLIFQDKFGVGKKITRKLLEAQHPVITVKQGEEFTVNSENSLTISGNQSQDYQAILEYLSTQNYIPQQIAYLWAITESNSIDWEFQKLLLLIQALQKHNYSQPLRINIITNKLADILGGETISVSKATLLGMAKVINQEYDNFDCRIIDISLPSSDINTLITECLTPSQNLVTAYRNNYPWHLSYQPYKINNHQSHLKQQGVYVIIGNISQGLGLIWAKYLVENFQAKIVLIGNNIELPKNSDSEYLTIEADISDKEAVNNALSEAEKHFGKIDGAFYSTPMTNKNSASLISEMTLSHWEYNYQTKIQPLEILENCLENKQLDLTG